MPADTFLYPQKSRLIKYYADPEQAGNFVASDIVYVCISKLLQQG